jgi:hypothetical protein
MKRSKFTEAQIAFILPQAEEGAAIGEVCRKAGISEGDLLRLWTAPPVQEDLILA